MSVVTDNIFMLLKKNGMTAKELAERIGTTQTGISKWKKGSYQPTPELLERTAKVFSLPVSYFFEVHEEPEDNSFRGKLTAIMRERNVTAKEIAEALGLSAVAVSKWKTGKSEPSLSMRISLAQLFDLPETYFFDDELSLSKPQTSDYSEILSEISINSDKAAIISMLQNMSVDDARYFRELLERFVNKKK